MTDQQTPEGMSWFDKFLDKITDRLWKRLLIALTIPIWVIPVVLVVSIMGFAVVMWQEAGLKDAVNWVRNGSEE